MTEPIKKKRGRQLGSKNKPRAKNVTEFKALADMGTAFAESAYRILSSDPDKPVTPKTKMEVLVLSCFTRAIDPEDKTAHQFAKLLFERAIPQRKQVEHLGELDAQRLGVNINVITNKAKEIIDESITIEHESVNGKESSGPELLSDGKTH